MIWYPGWVQQSERYGYGVTVKVMRIAKNGIWIEVPLDNGETHKIRVGRDLLKYPRPPPYRPAGLSVPRPFAPPAAPPVRPFVKPRLAYVNPEQVTRTPRTGDPLRVV
jgi:hypothetical protein